MDAKIIKNDKGIAVLQIQIPVSPEGTVSESGKSLTVATTRGAQAVAIGSDIVKINVNAYKANPGYIPPAK